MASTVTLTMDEVANQSINGLAVTKVLMTAFISEQLTNVRGYTHPDGEYFHQGDLADWLCFVWGRPDIAEALATALPDPE